MGDIYYYLVTLTNGKYSPVVAENALFQIKGKSDASAAIIASELEIEDSSATKKNENQTENLLDDWIDEENASPPKDFEGKDVIQEKIKFKKWKHKE